MLEKLRRRLMQTITTPLVSVIIPAFNEENNIASTIARTEATLESLNLSYEVIVIDDGSHDNTKLNASNNGAKLITYNPNRGKGYALRQGFATAKGQFLVTLDSDGDHRPDEIPRLIKPLLNGVDIVIGSRYLGNSRGEVTSKLNDLGNRLLNFLVMILTSKKITDSQTGFRAYRRKALKEIELFSNGYEIESELTVKSLKNGFRVQEEPITCDRRKSGKSKLKPLSDGIRIFKAILKASFM